MKSRIFTMRSAAIAAILAASAPAIAGENAASSDALVEEARGIVARFSEKLKSELTGAMKAEGPVKAIEVCHVAAPAIASKASAQGWTVGRTALKLRNRANAPDAWERQTLEFFEAEKAKGADIAKLERWDIAGAGGAATFRYMKAIPVAEPCLICHGSEVKEPVKAKLAALYPDDEATGFKSGDIRGAFTLSKPLE